MTSPNSGTFTPSAARGDCSTGKVQFANRKQAKRGRRFRNLEGVSVYRCTECDWFHLGHLPKRVKNGEVDKSAWLKATRKETA